MKNVVHNDKSYCGWTLAEHSIVTVGRVDWSEALRYYILSAKREL